MQTKTIPTKTFIEVHKELENESLFLHKNHNIEDFGDKANFLSSIGFVSSIATKVYSAISLSSAVINDYKRKYGELYKFILTPQLERVCEKYNLYVRSPKFFLGDIPEKNINDMLNFKIYIDDLPISAEYLHWVKEQSRTMRSHRTAVEEMGVMVSSKNFKSLGLDSLVEIASVKSLFSKEAFKSSNERIIGQVEVDPKNQVELDPVVLFKTKHGYLIITAWGDESNDELIFNEKQN